MFSSEGRFVGSLVVIVDISERASLVEQFKAQSEILNTLGDSFILTDLDGKTLYVSEVTLEKGDWKRETTLGVDVRNFVIPEYHFNFSEMLDTVKKGEPWFGDLPTRHGDGQVYHGLTHASPLRDSHGQIVGVKAITVGVRPYKGPITLPDPGGKIPELGHLEAIKVQLDKIGQTLLQTRNLAGRAEEPVNRSSYRLEAGLLSKAEPAVRKNLEIYCLGPLKVYSAGKQVHHWPGKRARAVFEYLIARHQTPVIKHILEESLWPNQDPRSAAQNLRAAVHDLRQVLGGLLEDKTFSFVLYTQGSYILNPELEIFIDAAEFERLFNEARHLEKSGEKDTSLRSYQQAEALYHGDYLEDELYEEWVINRREAIKDEYLLILNKMAEFTLSGKDYEGCIFYCQKILAKDICREDVYRQLIRCYSRMGLRNRAIQWYRTCQQTIKTELHSGLDPKTQDIFRRLTNGEDI
jgi:PAS domain S-box-containing protein